ncbi:MAG TPA: N-acetylmuramoyl-L-alanine amidase [Vicinamibacterales bacterium]|nr:N-acetylmuramoyl-L-alanine amidase [Vicinamibacterales bacterium]
MLRSRLRPLVLALIVSAGVAAGLVARPATQGPAPYTVFTSEGRGSLPVRLSGTTELVALERVAELFGLTVTEDPLVEGLTIVARDQRITLIPNQSFVSVGGRIDSLSAPVLRDRTGYFVPLDFLPRAVGRALGQRVEVRRDSRLIIVGTVRVPQITVRFERIGTRGRLDIGIEPGTPHQVTREDNRLLLQFDAAALDLARLPATDPDFVAGARVDETVLTIELGPSVASFRADSSPDESRLMVELLPPTPTTPTPPAATTPATPPPVVDLSTPGVLRTVVIDPGHGGNDAGARGPGGTLEKTVTLQIATRLRTAIESRLGLRVLLTREGDIDVPIDRRSALANNNKADLFISLHANAAATPAASGAQAWTLSLEAYRDRAGSASGPGVPLSVIGGGTRVIEAVPWDLAQLPFADRSTALGAVLMRNLRVREVPLFRSGTGTLPLRGLVGGNMPAILLEMGFLSSPSDERALTTAGRTDAIIDAIVDTITEMRRRPAGPGEGRP